MTDTEALTDVRNLIATRPDEFDNRYWAARWKLGHRSRTTHCVGGWALTQAGARFDWHPGRCDVYRTPGRHVLAALRVDADWLPGPTWAAHAARDLLGLDDQTARLLFAPDLNGTDVLRRLDRVITQAGAARVR
jgi:hypothetical protein